MRVYGLDLLRGVAVPTACLPLRPIVSGHVDPRRRRVGRDHPTLHVFLQQPQLDRVGVQPREQRVDLHKTKRLLCQRFLCLFRACLGKMFAFSINRLQKVACFLRAPAS